MLHDENASILTLLPALASGLISKISTVDVVLNFIDQEVAKLHQNQEKADRFLHVKKQLQNTQIHIDGFSLDIDEQKSIILAYTFGELYTPALALLIGNHISIQFWGLEHGVPSLQTIERCIMEPSGVDPLFIQVSNNPSIETKVDIPDVNPFLQLRAMVAKLGLLMNLSTFDLEQIEPRAENTDGNTCSINDEKFLNMQNEYFQSSIKQANSVELNIMKTDQTLEPLGFQSHEKVFVDPSNWFCSCAEFTMQSFEVHEKCGSEILGQVTGPLVVKKLFQNKDSSYPNTLPICKHILAVMLMIFNWPVSKDASIVKVSWFEMETKQVDILLQTDGGGEAQ